MRQAEQDSINDQLHGPNGTSNAQQGFYDDNDDGDYDGRDGMQDEDGEYGDQEGDDGLDDDMMDKISSSPSIDDGKYTLPPVWPIRKASLPQVASSPRSPSFPSFPSDEKDFFSSLEPPQSHFSSPCWKSGDHHQGWYVSVKDELFLDGLHSCSSVSNIEGKLTDRLCHFVETEEEEQDLERAFDEEELKHFLLPTDDPLLDYEDDDDDESGESYSDNSYANYESGSGPLAADRRSFDDEPNDFLSHLDTRLLDSGWGGECLRDLEDIDFEFVYALHTFVATVEGQANATKGDTMVLLDDSNSYWWLVRVVKDGSIGDAPFLHYLEGNT